MSLSLRSSTSYRSILLTISLCFGLTIVHGQEPTAAIRLNNRSIELPPNAENWLRNTGVPTLALMQFDALPDDSARMQLQKDGVILHSYLGSRTFVAYIDKKRQRSGRSIRSIVPIDPSWKLASTLDLTNKTKPVDVVVAFVPGAGTGDVMRRISTLGGALRPSPLAPRGYYEVSLPASNVAQLAKETDVLYIGPSAKDVPLNLESQRATNASLAHVPTSSGGWGLLGDSITIGVGDQTSGLFHVDVRDRIINYHPVGYGNHGQHVNGTVGGAGTMDPRGEGFAPHAALIDHLYSLVWARTGAMLQAHNMTVTNNSYANVVGSCSAAGIYDVYAQALDTLTLLYPEVFHVFASGNDGGSTCGSFPTGFATVTGGYQAAKNVLVVGNATKLYDANPGTSRGPIRDGRLKPEISSVGSEVYSTKGGDIYLAANGTSMACPQVSGGAALLQQRYKQLHAGAYPPSALVKALLMNGALDIGIPGPDFTFGFGIMDLSRSLSMMDSNRYRKASTSHGSHQTVLTIPVPANTGKLKVMLYWHDAPASPMAAKQLVNDLDLKVKDPSNVDHLPQILDPSPARVTKPSSPGQDHLNNVEQVVIDHPAAGNYSVDVSGFAIPSGTQEYFVVYDVVPEGIAIATPHTDIAYKSGDPLTIYWDASPGGNTFRIEYSTDNGNTWKLLGDPIPAKDRLFVWGGGATAGINSSQCRVRITRNITGEQAISGPFTLNRQPQLQLDSIQCPGYVALHWSAVPGADSYKLLRKIGPFLQLAATVTDTAYTAGGLQTDSIYYFAVEPLFGSSKGYRSMAISRRPDNGSCNGAMSDGDLMLAGIVSPLTGRLGTSTELTSNETVSIQVRNLDDAGAGLYEVSYQLNGGAWISQTLSGIPKNGSAVTSFTGLNMSAPGAYIIRAAVKNLSAVDRVTANDTILKVVRQLQNPPLTLSSEFKEDFESFPRLTLWSDTMGLSPDERWDYFNSNDTGRLRTFVDRDIAIAGSRSISMDMQQNAGPVLNRLTGTFNLSAADISSDEVRVEFDYRLHGKPRSPDSNKLWVRGADTMPWVPIYEYTTAAVPGSVINSGTLSLTDALSAAGQFYSSSTQLTFGQRDTSVIAEIDYGNGLTVDNVRLYRVTDDVGISTIISPAEGGCEMTNATPLTIKVYNGVTKTINNISVHYQLDGGPVVSETIPSLPGKTSVNFTFSQPLNASAYGAHTLNIWLTAANDSYHPNDSIMGYVFRNEPLISSYPYLQDFESGDGYWYADGRASSWEFGTPSATMIHKAASGTNAWKTHLSGTHNDNEHSYLYSPCFDIAGLSNPMLSFSAAMDIEDCDQFLCDGAWLEYSIGGGTWQKLGAYGEGTNWYSDSTYQLWKNTEVVRWKVATIPLPAATQPIRLRFVMLSDAGLALEGLAVDDIHIYDRAHTSYAGGTVGPVTQAVTGPAEFISGGSILARLDPGAGSPGKTEVYLYDHDNIADAASSQYFLPKNFVIQTERQPADSILTRLYITDADVLRLVNATGCAECTGAEDAYELGITKYENVDPTLENGSLADNAGGSYEFIQSSRIRWVPYDAGYYAELKLSSFSEIWFNAGGPAQTMPVHITALEFDARKASPEAALVTWRSLIDTLVTNYEIQRSENAKDFSTVRLQGAAHDVAHAYSYLDVPGVVAAQALYYRLRYTLANGRSSIGPVRQVIWSGRAAAAQIYPNPTTGAVRLNWSAMPGSSLDVTVTDITGRVVLRADGKADGYNNLTELNLNVRPGTYFLHAVVSGEKFDFKLSVL